LCLSVCILDPAVLYAPIEKIRDAVYDVIDKNNGHPAYVFNLGHGIYPDINPDHVTALIDAVHEYKVVTA